MSGSKAIHLDGNCERVDLPITGMTCAACARRIERKLSKMPGASRAGVNFATSRATVEYDPQATGVGALVEAVKEVGYALSLLQNLRQSPGKG